MLIREIQKGDIFTLGWLIRYVRHTLLANVLNDVNWTRDCLQTNWALISTRIMTVVVILHVIHNFTENFILL
jgi:hypothetical protein